MKKAQNKVEPTEPEKEHGLVGVKPLVMRDDIATNGTWTQLGSRIPGTSETYWPPPGRPMLFFAEDEGRYFKGSFQGDNVLDENDRAHWEWPFLWCTELAPTDECT